MGLAIIRHCFTSLAYAQFDCALEAYTSQIGKVRESPLFQMIRYAHRKKSSCKKTRLAQSRSNLTRFPPRIASFSALLRKDAFKIVSTLVGQLNGSSVPNTT
jgi:hypothetical protein